MNKKAENGLSLMDILYTIFWTGITVALVCYLWPLILGVLAVVLDFEELITGF